MMKKYSKIGAVFSIGSFLAGCGSTVPANSPTNTANTAQINANRMVNSSSTTNVNASIATKSFSKTMELHGIKFVVESPNLAAGNTVRITPSGLEVSNEVQTKSVSGEVYGAEISDLNVDQSPEVYIYTRETGNNNKTRLIAYSANKKKSLSEINIPAYDPSSKDLVGFKGGDEFAVVENSLVRRFPVYEGASADAKKTGKTRQIHYKLKPGEASWQLIVDKVTEF